MASLHRLAPVDTPRLARHSSLPNLFLGEPELLSYKTLCTPAPAFHSFPSSQNLRSKLLLCRALSAHNFDELPYFDIPAADACHLFSRPINICPTPAFQKSPRKEALMAVGKQISLDMPQSIVYTELKESMWKFEAPLRFLRPGDSEAHPSSAISTHMHECSKPMMNPNLCTETSSAGAKGRPLSLRMLKRKLSRGTSQADCNVNPCRCSNKSERLNQKCPSQQESMHGAKPQNFSDARDSVSTALASLFCILKMLQQHTHALRIWCQPSVFEADRGGYESLVCRAGTEMLDSLLWMFQQVFSCTPELMLLTMVLLADFTLHSMSKHVAFSVLSLGEPPPRLHVPASYKESGIRSKTREGLLHDAHSGADENVRTARKPYGVRNAEDPHATLSSLLSHNNVHEKQRKLASGLKEMAFKVPMKLLVAPMHVPTLEADDYPCFDRTDLAYQHAISRDPRNSLLLANYAQFLHLVRHDYGRAEQLYKRAMDVEAEVDGDVMGRFASFLWVAKGDVAEADKAFKAATVADPTSAFHAGNYAHFLWNTSAGQA